MPPSKLWSKKFWLMFSKAWESHCPFDLIRPASKPLNTGPNTLEDTLMISSFGTLGLWGGHLLFMHKFNNLSLAHRDFFSGGFMGDQLSTHWIEIKLTCDNLRGIGPWIKYLNLSLLQPSDMLPVPFTGQSQPEKKWQENL